MPTLTSVVILLLVFQHGTHSIENEVFKKHKKIPTENIRGDLSTITARFNYLLNDRRYFNVKYC